MVARDKTIELQQDQAKQWRLRYEELLRKVLIMEGVSTDILKDFAALKKSYFNTIAISIKLHLSQKGKPFRGFDVKALYSQAEQIDWKLWEEWLLGRAKEMSQEVQIQPTTYLLHY